MLVVSGFTTGIGWGRSGKRCDSAHEASGAGIGFASVFSGFTTGFAAIVVSGSGSGGAGIGSGLIGPGTVVSSPFFLHPFRPFAVAVALRLSLYQRVWKGAERC